MLSCFKPKTLEKILHMHDVKYYKNNANEIINMLEILGYYNLNIQNEQQYFMTKQIIKFANACIFDEKNKNAFLSLYYDMLQNKENIEKYNDTENFDDYDFTDHIDDNQNKKI